ncbi:FecCD family ABC transporter permease [Achromobacter deleyi]|uniref:FecCD family ABC transporter permease n=1 Tax=Achromobacter deleyi TaxID=1353891 RepID=UPI001490C37C|nr:iron ABC transporter permease [Achromobacter deleyi]QVQ24701.1 iron ABC transporter permease [Achromobacter deleyi]UIP20237.1 iron ABC transporter permease [Achromobacter deleyi]
MLAAVIAAMIASLGSGRYPVSVIEVLQFLSARLGLAEMETQRQTFLSNLLWDIRLPRVLAAVLVGAALSVSGAAYQAVFRNPLVSPGLMGVLAGAACGAALGMLLSGDWRVIQAAAFGAGVLAVLVSVGVARFFGREAVIMLVLGGVVTCALFTSLLSLIKYVADPQDQLPAIVYWLMGSLALATLDDVARMAIPIGLGVCVLFGLARALDAMSMGDDEARTLGVPVTPVRYATIAAATLACAATVAIAGMIGWIGLLIPHIARLLSGPSNSRLLPTSACLGAIFLLGADMLARNLIAEEIPIGIVIELLGVPAFLLVLRRARRSWL